MPYDEITPSSERQLIRTENFVDYHPGFSSLLHGPILANVLKHLTRNEMLLFKDKINYKLAGGNGFGTDLNAPACDHIGAIEHTTANLAVDPATLANGYVKVIPRSHRTTIDFAEGGRITDEWIASHTWVPIELDTADPLISGSHLVHKSGPNTMTRPLASVYATCHTQSDGDGLRWRCYADRRENFCPDHEMTPGKDYGIGPARYDFAAPFTTPERGVAVGKKVVA